MHSYGCQKTNSRAILRDCSSNRLFVGLGGSFGVCSCLGGSWKQSHRCSCCGFTSIQVRTTRIEQSTEAASLGLGARIRVSLVTRGQTFWLRHNCRRGRSCPGNCRIRGSERRRSRSARNLSTPPHRQAALGSVAEEVFRMVNCPVFVLGTKAAAAKKRKPSRLVFATDLEPHSLAALSQLSSIGDRLGVEISVIRAVHPDITSRTERNRIRKETVQKVAAAADSALRRRIGKIHVEFAHPVKAIVGFANRFRADAIVMGIRSGSELTRAATHIPWALAHRVINEAACPVLTIRA